MQAAISAQFGFLVDAALALPFHLKCLTTFVTYARERSMPASSRAAVEELAGRADERGAGLVLLVAGLLADEHDLRVRGPLAEDPFAFRCARAGTPCSQRRPR
jgi:hypothetical protein